jgi:hypothetical protein
MERGDVDVVLRGSAGRWSTNKKLLCSEIAER